MNKLRSDSAFCQLTPEQTDMLEGWLFEERLGYPRVVEKLQAEFGLETSLTAVRRFYKRLDVERSAQSLMEAAEMSGWAVEALKGGTIKPGMLLLANKCAFQLMMQPEPPIRKVTALLRAITSAEAHTMRQTIYEREQADRKEAERVRKVAEEWRRVGREIEREDEELRQKRAARKKAKQAAAEKAAKESASVAEQKLEEGGRVAPAPPCEPKLGEEKRHLSPAQWLPKPAPSQFPEEERALRATGSPKGGEGEETSVTVAMGARREASVVELGVRCCGSETRGPEDGSAEKDGGDGWQPSVLEDAENNIEDEVENRLTPLNAV